MAQKQRKSKLLGAQNVLSSLFKYGKLGSHGRRWNLMRHWSQVVGQNMASKSLPVAYERGVLVIWVRHATQMQELMYLNQDIKSLVNNFMGFRWVQKIRFTQDVRKVRNYNQLKPLLDKIL